MPDDSGLQKKIEKPLPQTETAKPESKTEQKESDLEQLAEQIKKQETVDQEATQTVTENIGESTHGIATAASIRKKNEERLKKIEEILADDLDEIYNSLPPESQKEFKVKGEETAKEINSLMEKAKFKVRKVLSLIRSWLSLVPGVNKFFLEQETKIKADEIVKLRDDKLYK